MMLKRSFRTAALIIFFYSNVAQAQITPANNKIGLDVSTQPQNTSFNYDSCFALGANLGMSQMGIFQNWTAVETAPNTFNMILFDIANYYYPLHSMPIDLTISPISTNNLEVPSDLTTTTFDNPIFINRFKTLLDSIKTHIPSVTLSSLIIGSEHDIYIGANATLWGQYTTFYNSVSSYAKTLWPGLKVATELTFNGLTTYNTFAQTLNTNSDYIGVSYYPLNTNFTVKPVSTIPIDFATLVGLYPSKPICFYQYDYPSSPSCNSSQALQKQFIAQTFTSWDTYATNIRLIDFTWLHDLDTATVNYYGTYYGISDTIFLEYLHTLGLRTWNGNGTDKQAFLELECQAKARGYNSLPLACSFTEINENSIIENGSLAYPNPANDFILINFADIKEGQAIQIINSIGMIVWEKETTESNKICTTDLSNGVYFIKVKGQPKLSVKFIKQ
jgi:hypothetical protein